MDDDLTPEDIRVLFAHGEGQRLEYKRSLAELETGARAVTAMANTDGGQVIIGVRDDGTIIGIEFSYQNSVAGLDGIRKDWYGTAVGTRARDSIQSCLMARFARNWRDSWRDYRTLTCQVND